MGNPMVRFLLLAIPVALATFLLLGGILLPRLGLEGPLVQGIAAGVAGMLVAIIYSRTVKRRDGA